MLRNDPKIETAAEVKEYFPVGAALVPQKSVDLF